jgi:hypothetical protein
MASWRCVIWAWDLLTFWSSIITEFSMGICIIILLVINYYWWIYWWKRHTKKNYSFHSVGISFEKILYIIISVII